MTKKIGIPWEFKYNYMKGMVTTLLKGFLYEIREEYGAAKALEIYERLNRRDDRIKNMAHTLKDAFKIEGNDMLAIAKWFDIQWELMGIDAIIIERSNTINTVRIPEGCAWKTGYQDISDWVMIFMRKIAKTLNPRCTVERPKGMCAGDPYCEYITRIEE